ncbi:MAG TPA: enolase C-terminal domain-like protein [Gemmatimonadaceae bacterium]|nr:enolase C-terminal domain-like protein [Gemmatimonadaceae bacterium]
MTPRPPRELSRREFLAAAGAAAALPLVDRIAPSVAQPKRIKIRSVGLDFEREPLIRPTGFKGGFLTELWQPVARLDGDSGRSHVGIGTQSVLWCDPAVLTKHSESAGNALMLATTNHALQLLVGESFTTPIELLDRILPAVHAYAVRVTGLPNLRRTFALNALVPVDNAAWLLYAAENGFRSFDAMIPAEYRAGVSHRHRAVASLPSVTYALPLADVVQAARDGYFVIKLKLGQPGTQAEMLEKDVARLTEAHRALSAFRTPHTTDGKLRYDLDPNQRYERKQTLLRLLDAARRIGALDQVALVEEPFPDENDESVSDVPVRIVADESATRVDDALRRIQQGYAGFALKGIAKTLSETLKIARLAHERRLACMAADLTVNPVLVDWNKSVAARLAPFPGFTSGMMETNGHQQYRRWSEMSSWHPCAGASWRRVEGGVFVLNDDFYARSACILEEPAHYRDLVAPARTG